MIMPICKTLFLNFLQSLTYGLLSSLNDVYLNATKVIEDRDFAAVFVLPLFDPSGPIWILSRIYLTFLTRFLFVSFNLAYLQ